MPTTAAFSAAPVVEADDADADADDEDPVSIEPLVLDAPVATAETRLVAVDGLEVEALVTAVIVHEHDELKYWVV